MRIALIRFISAMLSVIALAGSARAQTPTLECKAVVDQTWVNAHKPEIPPDKRIEVFHNAIAHLINPIVTERCFASAARTFGVPIQPIENSSQFTAKQALLRLEDASAAYTAIAQCPTVAPDRTEIVESLGSAKSIEDFENRFASRYPKYVSRLLGCQSFLHYFQAPSAQGNLNPHSPILRPHFLDAVYSPDSPTGACQITPGSPCRVLRDTAVVLILENSVTGTTIVNGTMQPLTGTTATPLNPTQGAQNIQVPIDKQGKYLLTVLLNKVQPKNPIFSVSLAESCKYQTDIIYFLDSTSRLGQVEIEVH
jgi:hypothetical protein